MISIPGIFLATGQPELAREVLRSYAGAMSQGLIPNRFPDQGEQPEYNTADATLWFVNSVYLTLRADWQQDFAEEAMAWLDEVHKWHQKGTKFGIVVDRSDGLLRQGAAGVQLTWMDAKVGDWVVTPRHGKPVEVNGLWANALRVMEWLSGKLGLDSMSFANAARQTEDSFRAKFWKGTLGHYLDTIEPDDASLRPNQLIAMALPFGPAVGPNAKSALAKIKEELLTSNGIRTLGPNEPGYHGRYEGSLPERDAAYHQGTAWPWLVGQYSSAVHRLTGDVAEARSALEPARQWMEAYGFGGIAEVFDGDAPQFPGGCPWQAWSVAEILRAWVSLDEKPAS
jgi:predicted glycogen debranching enzyme